MKRMSLQWRLTCITTLCIAIICGCLTMFVYKNGVHYIDSLQDAVESQWDEKGNKSDEIYISIPDDKWDEFADEFSFQVYNNKADYKRNSLIITVLLALLGGVVTYFISGHALRPIREFSDKIEEVQAQNLSDSRIEENNVKELNQLGISYNKMLERLSEAFEIQRQFTANAAHELRTPLALMQVQLDLYNSASHPGNDADTLQTIKMVTEQNDKLNRMVKTLLDMSELQTVGRDDKIILDAIVEEVLADLEPLAVEKNIKLIGKCEDATMIGSDILIYRLVYNLVENAIKYNHPLGQVTVTAYQRNKHVYLSVEDTGSGGGGGSPGVSSMTEDEINAILSGITDSRQKAVCSYALHRVGYPYSQELRDSGNYYDCSSLAYYSWKDAGVNISYGGATTAAAEAQGLDEAGKTVSYDEMQPGDLIFYSFTNNGRYKNISHVAVYVGNGKVVEALNERVGVVYRDVASVGKIVVIGRP